VGLVFLLRVDWGNIFNCEILAFVTFQIGLKGAHWVESILDNF
jgi:hypothetical protein